MPTIISPRTRRWRGVAWGVSIFSAAVLVTAVLLIVVPLVKKEDPVKTESEVWAQAQKLDNAHKYTTEQSVLKRYIESNPPAQYQYRELLQLGALALNRRDYAQALQWYKQSEAATGKVQLPDATGIAMAESGLGDKAAAIEYYRKAIQLSDPKEFNSPITSYRNSIRALGGTP